MDKKYKNYIENYFKSNAIKFEIMTEKEVEEYEKQWIDAYAANDRKRHDAYEVCMGDGYFLWHMFTYNLYDKSGELTSDCELADEQYKKANKKNCIMINQNYMEVPCYRLKFASDIDIEFIENGFEGTIDTVITSADFSWTYCYTHERGCLGNFFYKKGAKK